MEVCFFFFPSLSGCIKNPTWKTNVPLWNRILPTEAEKPESLTLPWIISSPLPVLKRRRSWCLHRRYWRNVFIQVCRWHSENDVTRTWSAWLYFTCQKQPLDSGQPVSLAKQVVGGSRWGRWGTPCWRHSFRFCCAQQIHDKVWTC